MQTRISESQAVHRNLTCLRVGSRSIVIRLALRFKRHRWRSGTVSASAIPIRCRCARSLWAILLSSTVIYSVWGHDNATLDAMVAPHHGQLRMAGPFHLELVVGLGHTKTGITRVALYVTDHAGIPSAVEKGSAQVVCAAGPDKASVHLRQLAPDAFEGRGLIPASPKIACTVTLLMTDATSWTAEFTPRVRRKE
jgi:hypothetical protein